jgi:carboxypeptidase C (cathepsin A)
MNSLYLSGLGYAGIHAPYLLHRIHTYNQASMRDANKLKLNLKGMMIFNGLTDPLLDQEVAMV